MQNARERITKVGLVYGFCLAVRPSEMFVSQRMKPMLNISCCLKASLAAEMYKIRWRSGVFEPFDITSERILLSVKRISGTGMFG